MPGYKAGGPIQSCVNLCTALKDQYEIYVFTTDTDHGETMPYKDITANKWLTNILTGVQVYYAKKKELTLKQVANIIQETGADFIYLNLLFSPHFVLYPLWLKYRGKINGRIILCPRGTLYDSALSLKWFKKKPLLWLLAMMGVNRQITFHATNEREKKAIEKYFGGSEIIIADNLPEMNQPAWTGCRKEAGNLQCIFIARIVPIKNLLFLLKILNELDEQVSLTITGPVEDEAYWQECKNYLLQLRPNIHVHYTGPKKNDELLFLLQQHHLFILPTTGENFGHAIFESLLAARPVLISDQTPWHNLRTGKAGWDIPLNKSNEFVSVLKLVAGFSQKEFDEYTKGAWTFANKFINNPLLKKPYYRLFK